MTDSKENVDSPRKRRKSSSADIEDLFPQVERLEIDQIYPKTCEYYDELSENCSADEDWEQYRKCCSHISNIMLDIAKLKIEKPVDWETLLAEKRSEVPLTSLYMKKLNRCEKLRVKSSREKTVQKKAEVEALYLQLQNIIYEIRHILNEVEKCMELGNMNFGIDLIPVEEFYKEAPSPISNPEVTKNDEHQRQLARLEWELKQRKDKASLCDQLENQRKKVIAEIKKKETVLDSLKPLVSDLVNAAKPLGEKLNVATKPSEPIKKYNLTSLLPDKLYFLYVQADAYREACDKKLVITIAGNLEAAKKFKPEPLLLSDQQEKGTVSNANTLSLEQKQKKIMTKHPLSVKIKITLKDRNSICLTFHYLVYLKIVSVAPRVTLTSPISSNAALPLLRDRTILNELFPDDTGLVSPNPTNYYQLKKLGLDKLDIEQTGLVYHWVQRLAGLDFAKSSSKVDRSVHLTQVTIPAVIKSVRQRLISRLTLTSQIISFESGHVSIPVSMAGVKLTSSLSHWSHISYPEFASRPFTKFLLHSSSIGPHDFYYRAIIKKNPAIIESLVVLKPNYPSTPPTFVFQFLVNRQKFNSRNNCHIRDLEREVNVFWEELVAKNRSPLYLLSALLHRALVLSEIVLSLSFPQIFSDCGKTLLDSVRGRPRSLPLKYVPIGEGLFVHR